MHYVNIVLTPTVCGSGERNGVQWRTKVSFGKPLCKHWSCCSWQKGTSPDKATLNSEEIKRIAIAIIELHLLSEDIGKLVSKSSHSVNQSVENSVK